MTAQELDSNGDGPDFLPGDRVEQLQQPWTGLHATVIKQHLHCDGLEYYWGLVDLEYDDGKKGTSHNWSLKKL